MSKVPHLVQYQGSKRILASQILGYMPEKFGRLIEPFSGTAAISMACAYGNKSDEFYINDINEPLILMLKEVTDFPDRVIRNYESVWKEQFVFSKSHIEHFYHIRGRFNGGDTTTANMLYLLARCVKGSVRYGRDGKFNQSPDKRRHGTNPKNMAENIHSISRLLRGKTHFSHLNYKEAFDFATAGDLIYMDPPYQGVCAARDNRYLADIDFDEFCNSLEYLNKKNIDYLVSYDGACGDKSYGKELPKKLNCKKIILNAGASTQQTLLGNRAITYESLYISESLYDKVKHSNKITQLKLF